MKFSALLLASACSSVQAFAPSTFHQSSHGIGTRAAAASLTPLEMASSSHRRPFISGNWKLNPQSREEAVKLATEIAESITPSSPNADVALFVPYVFIEASMNAVGDKLQIGAEVRIAQKERRIMFVSVA